MLVKLGSSSPIRGENKKLKPPPSMNKGLIAGLIKGNQWLSPDHKALFLGGVRLGGGGGYVATT